MIQVEKFNVRFVKTGDRYGLKDCLINDKAPMVEFWDSTKWDADFSSRGQFVSRYYASTLLERPHHLGLCLDGGVPEWSISAEDMEEVLNYIEKEMKSGFSTQGEAA